MDIVNITLWSEATSFPVLTTLTLVPLITMLIVLLLPSPVLALRAGFVGAILTILLSIYLLLVFDTAQPGIQLYEQIQNLIVTYTVGVDGTSVLFIPLTAILMLVALIYTTTTRRSSDRIQIACILGYGTILIAAFSAMNALQFWFFCLLELVPVVIMTIRAGSGQNRRWVVALLLQHWGSGLLMVLAGFMLLGFGVMGTNEVLSFDWFALRHSDTELEYATLIFVLLFFGFAIRMPLFPFHAWLPILAEQGTIASAGIFLIGIKLGIYAVIRFVIPFIPETAEQWADFVMILGLIGIFYGALLALMQINIRRLLAFAVISQTGMLIIGVFDFNTYGMEGSVLLSLSFGLATAGILFSIGMIYKRMHTAYITRLGGMFDANPAIAVLFVICALSTMVMPGTPGFDGIHLLVEGTIKGHGWLVSIAILIGNVLAAALLLRAFQQIFIAEPKRFQGPFLYSPKTTSTPPSVKNEGIIATVICSLIIVVGVNTSPWLHMIDQGVSPMSELHSTTYNEQHTDTTTVLTNTKDIQDE
ncbi:NuoM family protein [uncultured Nitrosomonas sp.]|uniref:complex I subunit 4 family protein n=1 Tax=uncultured Nitrosomonas sp. TaxID=156424 RepID=UPI0025D60428|nr:NADH-quinone oxidoreductase subunit M [uncultured Nitrosomonas sp.]